MKYIDADKLIALIDAKLEDLGMSSSIWVGRIVLQELKVDIIESLQQEQPEVDLEKEMDEYYDSPLWDGENVSWMTYTRIARHFYELGLNTRKEE